MSLYNSSPALDASIKDILNGKKEVVEQGTNLQTKSDGSDLGDKEFKLKSAELKFKVKKHNDDRWDKNIARLHNRVRADSRGETYKESKDTPGNSYAHQCAVHVKSEQFGEGKTLYSQHAEPDENGNIAWYDVMFEEGIKRVNIEDIEILVSENHKNHKKMAEDVQMDEARGRPRKVQPAPGEDNSEPDQNIVNHLKKSIDTGGNHDVKFDDKSSHKVPAHVAHKVLSAMGKLKPSDRLEVQKHIQQSHKNLMHIHGMVK